MLERLVLSSSLLIMEKVLPSCCNVRCGVDQGSQPMWSRTFFCIYILYSGDIGQLVFFFRGVGALEAKRLEIGGVSFRVISSPMNAAIRTRRRGSPDQNWLV